MKFCPHCGSEVSENDRYCRYCGYQLSTEYEEPMEHAPPPSQEEEHPRMSHHGCC